jgi:hypothetical protein
MQKICRYLIGERSETFFRDEGMRDRERLMDWLVLALRSEPFLSWSRSAASR